MALSEEHITEYTKIIDGILVISDLNTISEKRIRKGLQTTLGYDLTPQKDAVKKLIMERFDKSMANKDAEEKRIDKDTITLINGHKKSEPSETKASASPIPPKVESETVPSSKKHKLGDDSSDGGLGDVKDEPESSEVQSPPPKKKKRKIDEDADAVFARQLQAQENVRMRNTRGGGPKKAAAVKKKGTKKTAAKVRAEDDSDMEEDTKPKKEVRRNGAFHKELHLSQPLSNLLDGATKLSRPQTVKRIWEYVREHELQDPKDKRMIRCDENLKAVFKQDKVHMFTMNKILAQNLYPDD